MSKISIEPAQESEIDDLRKSVELAFKELSLRYLDHDNAVPPFINDLTSFPRLISKQTLFKVMLDGELVGGYHAKRHDQHVDDMYLVLVWIDIKFQNRGIGKQVWGHLEKTYHAKNWWLETPKFAISNHRFYEGLGFVKHKEFTDGIELIMYKKIIEK